VNEKMGEEPANDANDVTTDPALQRADDFLAPVLFRLVARVRREADRVTAQATSGRAAPWDPEAIHDLRVALRRLRTVLRPARSLFGRRHVMEIADGLRRLASATGRLRDAEVLRETLAALALPERTRAGMAGWLGERARLEKRDRQIIGVMVAGTTSEAATTEAATTEAATSEAATAEPTTNDSLSEVLDRLERLLGHRRPSAPEALALAEETVARLAGDIARRLDQSPSDATAMHDLRIAYKRLRYSAELFAPILGKQAKLVAKEAARMQKHLGELHDLDAALGRVRRAGSVSHATRTVVLRALVRARARCAHAVGRALGVERALLADSASMPEARETPEIGVGEGLDPEKATGNE
jgi:CHAD domain-containing protein